MYSSLFKAIKNHVHLLLVIHFHLNLKFQRFFAFSVTESLFYGFFLVFFMPARERAITYPFTAFQASTTPVE